MDTVAVLLVVLILAVIWRGPKTLPQIAAMLGRGVRGAREATKGDGPDKPKAG